MKATYSWKIIVSVVVALLLNLILFTINLGVSASTPGARDIKIEDFKLRPPDNRWELTAKEATSADGTTYQLRNLILKVSEPLGPHTQLMLTAPRGMLKGDTLRLAQPVRMYVYYRSQRTSYLKLEGYLREAIFHFDNLTLEGATTLLKEYSSKGQLLRVTFGVKSIMNIKDKTFKLMDSITVNTK